MRSADSPGQGTLGYRWLLLLLAAAVLAMHGSSAPEMHAASDRLAASVLPTLGVDGHAQLAGDPHADRAQESCHPLHASDLCLAVLGLGWGLPDATTRVLSLGPLPATEPGVVTGAGNGPPPRATASRLAALSVSRT